MKDVVFKAWHKGNMQMWNILKLGIPGGSPISTLSDGSISGNFDCYDNEFELLQFLGRTDRNKKKLFEGDIIKHWKYGRETDVDDCIDNAPEILLIESIEGFFKNLGYSEGELGEEWGPEAIEIIGNKFQNSNLIPERGINDCNIL